MAIKRKKGRKKTTSRATLATRRPAAPKRRTGRRRARKHGMLSSNNNNSVLLMQMGEAALGGIVGAVVLKVIPLSNPMIKAAAVAGAGVLVATQMKKPLIGAGMVAIAGVNLGQGLKLPFLADENFQEGQFYPVNDLQENVAYIDEHGFQTFPTASGYMLNENGQLSENLQEDFVVIRANN